MSRRVVGATVALALTAAVLVAGPNGAAAEEVVIVQDVTCQGATAETTNLLKIYFADTDGILSLETPMTVDIPEEMPLGGVADVTIGSQMSIPPEMVETQEALGVTTTLLDSNVVVEVAGGATALWEGELPPLPPPGEVIEVSNTEEVAALVLAPITYTLLSPFSLSIQIAGGIFTNPFVMALSCTFSHPLLGVTEVIDTGEWFAPDVLLNHDFHAEIAWMVEEGISTGFDDGMWRPSATLTRQAMAAFLYRIAGEADGPDPQCQTQPFPDVAVDNSFCGEIQWLKATGITTGNQDGTFNPTGGLTRQAMSAFLYRLAGEPDGADPQCAEKPFSDVPLDNPFCGEIAWMAEVGISNGYDDGTYKPEATLTRMAMAAFIFRYGELFPVAS